MVDKNELLYVVDEFDTPQKPISRQKVFKLGLWKRTVHIWIINEKKQIFCQKRSLRKDMSPGMWESAVSGHLGPDDSYFSGALRELKEEIGIEINIKDLNLVKIYKDEESHEYRGIFFYIMNIEESLIKKEDEEVDKIKFLSPKTVRKYVLYNKHQNWFHYNYAREMFSKIK